MYIHTVPGDPYNGSGKMIFYKEGPGGFNYAAKKVFEIVYDTERSSSGPSIRIAYEFKIGDRDDVTFKRTLYTENVYKDCRYSKEYGKEFDIDRIMEQILLDVIKNVFELDIKDVYFCVGRGNGKSEAAMNYLVKKLERMEANSTYGIATIDTWTSFRGGYTKSHTISRVIFHDPATIVYWTDGTKTVVKCRNGEEFDPEKGLAMAYVKHELGLKEFNKLLENAEVQK